MTDTGEGREMRDEGGGEAMRGDEYEGVRGPGSYTTKTEHTQHTHDITTPHITYHITSHHIT